MRLRSLPVLVLLPALIAAFAARSKGGAASLSEPRAAGPSAPLPPIVFVSRKPLAEHGAIPGLGPLHRAAAPGGRLLLREPGGSLRELLPAGALFDVSDPSVSPDAHSIVFAGTPGADSAWRICEVGADGGAPRFLTAPRGVGDDDLDPVWLDARTIVFASTRSGWKTQYDGSPAPQLWRLSLDDGACVRITSERNGVEEPCVDPRSGDIVYSRWWFNRWWPARDADGGDARASVTLDSTRAVVGDRANLWQAIAIRSDGSHPRLFAGAFRDRRMESLDQPAVLPGGGVIGVVADELGLSPRPGATELVWFASPHAPPRHVAGARFDPADVPAYGSARGLSAPSACSPAALPDGRVVFSYDPGSRGDFGLWVGALDGSAPVMLVNLPGTLELDPAPVVTRALPPARRPAIARRDLPIDATRLAGWPETFRFANRDVFARAYGKLATAVHRGAAQVRIRFWAELPGGAGQRDTLVLVREVPVQRSGRVDERSLPAGIPMFEQLVDDRGNVLVSSLGAAHVAGYNAGTPGETAQCIGCHRGHSIEK